MYAGGRYVANKAEEHDVKGKAKYAGGYMMDKAEEYQVKDRAYAAGKYTANAA